MSGTLGKTIVGSAPLSLRPVSGQHIYKHQADADRFLAVVVDDGHNVDCVRRQRPTIASPCSSLSEVLIVDVADDTVSISCLPI